MTIGEATGVAALRLLQDYAPPRWRVPSIDLRLDLDPDETLVTSHMSVVRAPGVGDLPLRLDAVDVEVVEVRVDGEVIEEDRLRALPGGLELLHLPGECRVSIITRLRPERNVSRMGLYVTSGVLVSQCEPEGFRRITCFPDRPDVLTRYVVTLVDRTGRMPVLLSNGNREAEGETAEGHRWVRWSDPHPKPCYLFALAAGDLESRSRSVSQRGVPVTVSLFTHRELLGRAGLALDTLARAVEWEASRFGRDYDLDELNLVVVRDFEGAMENKGLLVTGPMLGLFDPARSTDWDRMVIENTLSHEYLHNWTGNRITCRDWFQIGLKEGLTTFRHWWFSEDAAEPEMKRIWQARLYAEQVFAEEGGANVHAVRPAMYSQVSNLFTATVYKKGAEIARMVRTRLGEAGFRRGMDRFFEDCDGKAVTWEDWLRAMSAGSGVELGPYSAWWTRPGTPTVSAMGAYSARERTHTIHLRQSASLPYPIPVAFGLISQAGHPMSFRMPHEASASPGTRIVELAQGEMELTLLEVGQPPIASLLRGQSAPVHLEMALSAEELRTLALHDPDAVSRWRCLQDLLATLICKCASGGEGLLDAAAAREVSAIFLATLEDARLSDLLRYELLLLPEVGLLRTRDETIDVLAFERALRSLRMAIAMHCRSALEGAMSRRPLEVYRADAAAMGRRRVRGLCLAFLVEGFPAEFAPIALAHLQAADNMSDASAALEALCHVDHPARARGLAWFENRWSEDAEVMDKWLQAQARSHRADTLERVEELTRHPAFDARNPGRVRALLRTLAMENPAALHRDDGAGYRFLVDQQIRLDGLGEKTAAWSHLLDEFALIAKAPPGRRRLMKRELSRLLAMPGVAPATIERAMNCLRAAECPP